jgi:NAD(P)H-dependent flavin oxidoreductase YrpB (nitropropane dioxygenase family)
MNDQLGSLATPLCRLLGIQVPVIQAPIGSATTPQLAAAVSNAGGLGMLAITWQEPTAVPGLIQRVGELTNAPIGVNASLAFPVRDQVEAAIRAGIRVVSTFWDDPQELHDLIADAGAIHLHTVRSPAEATRAVEAGVDVVVAQGWEAGGHVWGQTATLPLITAVVDAVDPVPVVAAGGIADGRGLAAALVLGAQAVWVGTRFLTAQEAGTHEHYRSRLLAADGADAIYTNCFDGGWPNAPHRVLRNSTLEDWHSAGRPQPPHRPGEGEVIAWSPDGRKFRRYDDMMPLQGLEGRLDLMALYAGQSVGLVHDVRSATEVVGEIVTGAQRALARWGSPRPRGL